MNGDLDEFRRVYGLGEILAVPYGSAVYGTAGPKSDRDYIAVVPDGTVATGTEFRHHDVDVTAYSRSDFRSQILEHKVHALEAYFHPGGAVRKQFDLKLDLGKLRESFSAKASNSFGKAKKKIEVEHDFYLGWKSLFHSLRILIFGSQIADEGVIYDFGDANFHWFDIVESGQYNWPYFKGKYQPEYNRLASEFRKLAPKGKES